MNDRVSGTRGARSADRAGRSGLGASAATGAMTVAALILCMAATALAQVPSWARGTWPPVTASVTTLNGWVYVIGRTEGMNGGEIWRVPLSPAGPAVSVNQGISTTFVTVGPREFLIDDASGDVHELRNGQVWRRFTPRVPGTPSGPPPQGPPQGYPPPPPGDQGALTPAQREALQRTSAADERLQTALSRLDTARKVQTATPAMLSEAQDQVDAARKEAAGALDSLREQFRMVLPPASAAAPPPQPNAPVRTAAAPTARPAPSPPPQTEQEAQAQEKVLQATADLDAALSELNLLRPVVGKQGEADKVELKVAELRRKLDAAALDLRKCQLDAQVDRSSALDPSLRPQLAEVAKRVLTLTARMQEAEERVRQARDARQPADAGAPPPPDMQQAATSLLTVMRESNAAQQELAKLSLQASAKAPPESTTRPAP
jgi:hypothetical protein